MRDIASPLDGFASPFGVPVRFYPANIFGDGSNGLLWDYSATTGLYSDNLGATPLTAPDTGVGLVADRSRVRSPVTAYGGAQASEGFRPKWGRAPVSRRNLLTYTEFPGGVTDANPRQGLISAVSLSGYARALLFGYDGVTATTSAYRSGFNTVSGQVYTGSAIISMTDGAGPPVFSATVALNDFTLYIGGVACPIANHTVSAIGSGLYRISAWRSATVTGASSIGLVKQVVNSARTFIATAYQLETGSTATAYQSVTSTYDMTEAGVPSYGYIRPDRTDDVLSTVLTLAQTGDVAVFGRTGSKMESGLIYGAGATFSLGATTITGMSAGVLAAVGDVVGVLAIGRALTTAEKASTLAYFQARGAGAWL